MEASRCHFDMKKRILLSWSGGKDSMLALYRLVRHQGYEICAFLTTFTKDYNRSCMHGVRADLVRSQVHSLGFPLVEIMLSKSASNEEYEVQMRDVLTDYRKQGVSGIAFGDIFLEELKRYRESRLAEVDLEGIFPLWGEDTGKLPCEFLALGFKAVITCVDSKYLPYPCAGTDFNEEFLASIPPQIDPCGEHGEFHTFVYTGPLFSHQVTYVRGETVLRDNRFYFCDLIV